MSRYLGISPFDGPSDTRSRSGSQHSAGSQARSEGGRSRAGSASAAASGPKGYPKPLGFDPGREGKPMLPEEERSFQVGRRVDLPPEAFVKVSKTLYGYFLTSRFILTLYTAKQRPSIPEETRSWKCWQENWCSNQSVPSGWRSQL